MFIPLQNAAQAAAARDQAQAAQQQAQAAQQQAQAAQQELQAQIQSTTERAVEQALREVEQNGARSGMSDDAKQRLKDQIRAAIDAAREARADQNSETQPPDLSNLIPQRAVEIVSITGFTLVACVVGFPIARAIGRWIDRRGSTPAPTPASREVVARLEAIEQAVESVAVEVERMSEGQRFTARLLSERTNEPVGNFLAPERERVAADFAGNTPANTRRS